MKFSDLAMGLKASEIRELLKLTTMPEVISFAGGLPAPELFPLEELKKVDVEILSKEGQLAVQYDGRLPASPRKNCRSHEKGFPSRLHARRNRHYFRFSAGPVLIGADFPQ